MAVKPTREYGGYSGLKIDVRGIPEVKAMLGKLVGPDADKMLQRATAAGGVEVKKALVQEAPYDRLKRAVWLRRAKRQRPATVVGHHKKNGGFPWHMVAGGTEAHGPKHSSTFLIFTSKRTGQRVVARRVQGVHANPFVARAGERSKAAAMAAVTKVVEDYLNEIAGA
jgi:hypothetical protein